VADRGPDLARCRAAGHPGSRQQQARGLGLAGLQAPGSVDRPVELHGSADALTPGIPAMAASTDG